MNDWDIFTESIPWYVADDAVIQLDAGRVPTTVANRIQPHFPTLADLIHAADITSVKIDDVEHELFAWDSTDGIRIGWLCLAPPRDVLENVCKPHRLLLQDFGGVIERFNEPANTRLLNHTSVLTNHDASYDASLINDYSWAFNGSIPIDPSAYYTVAREANGNRTICHRDNGSILLFAPDHSFDDVTPFGDCPDFTLYNIHNASTLTEWVELIAGQWQRHTRVVA